MDDRNSEQVKKLSYVADAEAKLPWHAPQVFPLGMTATRSGTFATYAESVTFSTPFFGNRYHGDLS